PAVQFHKGLACGGLEDMCRTEDREASRRAEITGATTYRRTGGKPRSAEAGEVVDVDLPPALVGLGLLLDEVDALVRLGPALHVEDRALVGRQDLEHVLGAEGLELLLGLGDGHGALQAARVQGLLHVCSPWPVRLAGPWA